MKINSNSILIDILFISISLYFLVRLYLFNFNHKEAILHTDAIKKITVLLENIEGRILSLIEMSKSAGEQYVSSQKEMIEAITILSESLAKFKKETIADIYGVDIFIIENAILSDQRFHDFSNPSLSDEYTDIFEQYKNNIKGLKDFISAIFIPHRNMKMYAELPSSEIRPYLPHYENATSAVTSAAERFYNEYARVSAEISDLLKQLKNGLSNLNKLEDVAQNEKMARSGIYYLDILVPILFAAAATITFLYRVYIWICSV